MNLARGRASGLCQSLPVVVPLVLRARGRASGLYITMPVVEPLVLPLMLVILSRRPAYKERFLLP